MNKVIYIIIAAVVAIIVGVVVWTIFKNDPYAETMEGACYPEHRTWGAIKTRCFNPNHDGYARYGARGLG